MTDFLTRAKEAKYEVRSIAFNQALDRLQNFVSNGEDFDNGGEARAYALYVLARNGRAPAGELRYYVDTRLDRFATALSKAQLGAALAMTGDKVRAETAFKAALADIDGDTADGLYRDDYGSQLRDGAALITLASETRVAAIEAPKLVSVVAKAYQARSYTSTQEQAWMLLAAHALGDEIKGTTLAMNGAPVEGSVVRSLTPEDIERGVTVTNNGDAPVDAVVTVIGAALVPEPAVSKGFKLERSYYTLQGEKVDLASLGGGTGTVKQNDRFVAVVKIESDVASGRVLLVDRLPAGLQIENPRLVDSGDIGALDWLKSAQKPEHTEFRDDRFVAAFNLSGNNKSSSEADTASEAEGEAKTEEGAAEQGKPSTSVASSATVAYIVRAVTTGTYMHPAATIEDMYRPQRYARTAAGTLTVTAK